MTPASHCRPRGRPATISCVDLADAPILSTKDIRGILDTCATFVDWNGALPTGKAARESASRLWQNSQAKLPDILAAMGNAPAASSAASS